MELAKMEVSRAEIRKVHRGKLTSGMVGAEVAFSFDDAWDGLNRIAVFKAGGTVKDVLLIGESCVIPHEVLERPVHLVVGVYGTDADGSVVIPTVWADLGMVEQGAKPSGEISKKPTPEVWAQILGMIGDLKKLNTEDKSSLVAAINEVLRKGNYVKTVNGAAPDENGNVELPVYDGAFSVTPSADNDLMLLTAQTFMDSDIKVEKIPYAEVTNHSGGTTVTIGG